MRQTLSTALLPVIVAIGLAAASSDASFAETSPPTADKAHPEASPPATSPSATSPQKPGDQSPNVPLSKKLDQIEGVLAPPEGIDPKMDKGPPAKTGDKMPIIIPPGEPGGDQSIQPK
jgi:hypothetical protein